MLFWREQCQASPSQMSLEVETASQEALVKHEPDAIRTTALFGPDLSWVHVATLVVSAVRTAVCLCVCACVVRVLCVCCACVVRVLCVGQEGGRLSSYVIHGRCTTCWWLIVLGQVVCEFRWELPRFAGCNLGTWMIFALLVYLTQWQRLAMVLFVLSSPCVYTLCLCIG